jgi:alpha/beta superfamily hydrolase
VKPEFLETSGSHLFGLPMGQMEVLFNIPKDGSVGVVIIAHPQPLLGGSATHKVPQLLARALCEAGWIVARPNFRGAGKSTGVHGGGEGEADDILFLHDLLRSLTPGLRHALIGFSFGAYVQACVARRLLDRGTPAWRVCLAGMPSGTIDGYRHYQTPSGIPDVLVVHGEADGRVPLANVMQWARNDVQPVVVVPGADHFFSGKLQVLRSLILQHMAA